MMDLSSFYSKSALNLKRSEIRELAIIICMAFVSLATCSRQNPRQDAAMQKAAMKNNGAETVRIVLSKSLENRRPEFSGCVDAARINILSFAKANGWEALTAESFLDSVMIFDDKNAFNKTLLKLAGADTSVKLPETYCAALENRTLVAVAPEFYAKVYPDGVEERSYEKLLTHEIAHRLHVRILHGDEEAMGPIWFYEGFAMFAADQFSKSKLVLGKKEMITIMKKPSRGDYKKYSYIFRFFAAKMSLKELIVKAREKNFNSWLISKID